MAQLADDKALCLQSQSIKFQKIIDYAMMKYQQTNIIEVEDMDKLPDLVTTIILNEDKVINDIDDGSNFLGFKLMFSNDIYEIVDNNINSRLFNIAKLISK